MAEIPALVAQDDKQRDFLFYSVNGGQTENFRAASAFPLICYPTPVDGKIHNRTIGKYSKKPSEASLGWLIKFLGRADLPQDIAL